MTNEQYYEMIRPYQDAMNLMLTRLDVFDHTMYADPRQKPIHNIQSRIKSKKSIEEKMERNHLPASVVCVKENLMDIAGIRVISYFIRDVESLVHILKKQTDLVLIKERDYIQNPKPNGYRSFHLVVGVPVCYLESTEYYPVEIQIRTLGMDFWASLEHRVCYKQEREDKEKVQATLLRYEKLIEEMEREFEHYNETILLGKAEK